MSRRNTSSTASTVQNVDTLVQRSDGVTRDACTVVNMEVQAAAQAAEKVMEDLRRLTELENNGEVQAAKQLTETLSELVQEFRAIATCMAEFSKISVDINKCDVRVLQIQEETVCSKKTDDYDVWAMAHQLIDEAMLKVTGEKQAHETRRTELMQEIRQRKTNTRQFRQKLSKELPEKTAEYTAAVAVLQTHLHKVVEGLGGMCAKLDTATAPDGNPNAEVQAKQVPTEFCQGDYGLPATASETSQDDASPSRPSVKVKSGDSSVVSLQQQSKRRASNSHRHISPTKRQRLSDPANTFLSSTHSDTLREGTDEDDTDTMEGGNRDGGIQRASTSMDEENDTDVSEDDNNFERASTRMDEEDDTDTMEGANSDEGIQRASTSMDDEDDTDVSEDDNNFERIQRASTRMDEEDDTGTMEGANSDEGIQRAVTPMDEEDDTDTMEGDNSDESIQRAATPMDDEDDTDVNEGDINFEGIQWAGGTTDDAGSATQGIQDDDGSATTDADGSATQGIQDDGGSATQDDDGSKDGATNGSQDDDGGEDGLTHSIVSLSNDDNEGDAFLEEDHNDTCTPVPPPTFDSPFGAKWTLHHPDDPRFPGKYLKNARAYVEGRPPLKEENLDNWRTRYNMPVPCPTDDLRIWYFNTKTPNGRTFPAYIVQPASQCVRTMRNTDRSYYEVVTGAVSTVPLILDCSLADASVTLDQLRDATNTHLLPKLHAILAPLLNLPVDAVACLPLYQSDASSDTNRSIYLRLPSHVVFETLGDVKKMVLAPLIDALRKDPLSGLFFYTDQTGAKKCRVSSDLSDPIQWCHDASGALGEGPCLSLLQTGETTTVTLTLRAASCGEEADAAVQTPPITECLEQFNERYAVTRCGRKTCVIDTQHYDPLSQRTVPIVFDKSDFLNANAAEFALGEGRKQVNVAQAWWKWSRHTTYNGIVMEPGETYPRTSTDCFNLWSGFAVEPAHGDCTRILEHIRTTICGDDATLNTYMLDYLAYMLQQPSVRLPKVFVLCGGEDSAKTTFVSDIIGAMYGKHFVATQDSEQLTGHGDNSLLTRAMNVVAFLNTRFDEYNPNIAAALKALITGPTLTIGRGCKDSITIRNHSQLFMASNDARVAPMEIDDRRYLVINVSSEYKDDAYQAALHAEIVDGGVAAFMAKLLERDLSRFDANVTPPILQKAIWDVKRQILDEVGCFWYTYLHDAEEGTWRREVAKDALYEQFCATSAAVCLPGNAVFGRSLRNYVSLNETRHNLVSGKHQRYYVFPDLVECRRMFARGVKTDVAIVFALPS